ncbi:N-succinylarginine dihydrolase [Candidatus Protochlamydia phocaeensis]|uniref:N-succinylarginine dihydrolase n=1 Tax=Candidatus Protochlamydia phocaeensis TaxID=1414722 RepID=UPI0008393FE1|nr:N-succinylarginine dihydrolase [Candidatus Protochlamydia phocaeensis]
MLDQAEEINFDGLVGPTHNYSGLSYGNIASMEHGKLISNPKKAALQGLAKMYKLFSLGIKQAVLPPQERPFIPVLRSLGYDGAEDQIIRQVGKDSPSLLMSCSSAASMWAANAATISPSLDSQDHKVHFTPANLMSKFHRSFEAPATSLVLRRIFDNPTYFAHHYPLPTHPDFADEGAANHTRLCQRYDQPGIQLFVFGRRINQNPDQLPKRFPARQTDEASKAVARLHRLSPKQVIFAQQSPEAIDAGVFHNDVVAVGNQNVFFYHEQAYIDTPQVIEKMRIAFIEQCQTNPHLIMVPAKQVPLQEAVKTYLFNSQLVTLPDQTMALIAPQECQESQIVSRFLQELLARGDHPIKQVIHQDVRESMQNGGGPACLRLRVVLMPKEKAAMNPSVLLTEELYQQLTKWVEKHYRDHLTPQDLADPKLLIEGRHALDELTQILQLGPLYPFQMQRIMPIPHR